jgi:acetoacetyl-CoA synthetase
MWNYRTSALLLGATVVSYSGSPTWPDVDRIWRLAADLNVDVLGISPAYLLACRQAGVRPRQNCDLSSLRMIGSTGAPLPHESYWWVASDVAPGVPISSITGGTDVVTAFAAASPADTIWAGEISGACLGANLHAFDSDGVAVQSELGELVLTTAMPSMPVGFWDDPDGSRLHSAYFDRYPGVWCHGDWVTISERGTLVMHGRSDSTLNRNGVRMGSSEVYAAIETLPEVRDGLIIGVDHADGSYWMPLFVQLTEGIELDEQLRSAISSAIRHEASPRHLPDEIIAVPGIPRTRTGKRLEIPIKRLLTGGDPNQVVDRDAVDDVKALDWFIEFASRQSSS